MLPSFTVKNPKIRNIHRVIDAAAGVGIDEKLNDTCPMGRRWLVLFATIRSVKTTATKHALNALVIRPPGAYWGGAAVALIDRRIGTSMEENAVYPSSRSHPEGAYELGPDSEVFIEGGGGFQAIATLTALETIKMYVQIQVLEFDEL